MTSPLMQDAACIPLAWLRDTGMMDRIGLQAIDFLCKLLCEVFVYIILSKIICPLQGSGQYMQMPQSPKVIWYWLVYSQTSPHYDPLFCSSWCCNIPFFTAGPPSNWKLLPQFGSKSGYFWSPEEIWCSLHCVQRALIWSQLDTRVGKRAQSRNHQPSRVLDIYDPPDINPPSRSEPTVLKNLLITLSSSTLAPATMMGIH